MMKIEAALTEHGVSSEDIDKAKSYQVRAGGSLEKILLNMGSFSEELLPSVYSHLLDAPILSEEQRDAWHPPATKAELPNSFLINNDWLLFACPEGAPVQLLTFSPLNWNVLQYLAHENIRYEVIITSETDFGLLSLKLNDSKSVATEYGELSDVEEERLREMASEAPTVNLLNSLITRALRLKASDMHVEPKGNRYRVRFRIDGVLQDIDTLPQRLHVDTGVGLVQPSAAQGGRREHQGTCCCQMG